MADKPKLPRFGSYPAFRLHLGKKLLCEVRGWVTVCGLSSAPVPWPLGKPEGGRPQLIVYDWLVGAVRHEPEEAVARAWGVSLATVRRWRRALRFGENRELARRTKIGAALRRQALRASGLKSLAQVTEAGNQLMALMRKKRRAIQEQVWSMQDAGDRCVQQLH